MSRLVPLALLLAFAPQVLAGAPPAPSPDAGMEVLTLSAGTQRILSLPGLKKVDIGDPEVCDVKPLEAGELLLVGIRSGQTVLKVDTARGTSQWSVVVSPQAMTAAEAKVGEESTVLTLAIGEKKSLNFPGLKRTAIGDPAIADVSFAGDSRIELKGAERGVTTLLTWTAAGRNSPVTIVVGEPPAPKDITPAAVKLTVRLGEPLAYVIPGFTRIAIGDPAIADVTPGEAGQLTLKGLKAGTTTVLVWAGEARHTLELKVAPADKR